MTLQVSHEQALGWLEQEYKSIRNPSRPSILTSEVVRITNPPMSNFTGGLEQERVTLTVSL
jgi:hypothetical protein